MLSANVGHKVVCTIVYLDQNGNPMQTPPTPDSPPAWTSADATATPPVSPLPDSLAVSPDGTECDVTCSAVGTDTINLVVAVGGVAFNASLGLTIAAAPQVLTSVAVQTQVQ